MGSEFGLDRQAGTIHNIYLTNVDTDEKKHRMIDLIDMYHGKGGHHLQINCIDKDVLRDAQKHPENYPTLMIRVADTWPTSWSSQPSFRTTSLPGRRSSFEAPRPSRRRPAWRRSINQGREGGCDPGSEPAGAIWKIDRFATDDGPGIRTNIYFKGCLLRCRWCSNPEGQEQRDELGFLASRCTGCGVCFDVCPHGAIQASSGWPVVDRTRCDLCGACVEGCAPKALFVYGDRFPLSRLMDIIERDRHVYRRSGGGITVTGGEPLLQHRFVQLLLTACHDVGIHSVVETCGCVDSRTFRRSLVNVDWLFFDLKHIDARRHREITSRTNALILKNLQTASSLFAEKGKTLVLRQVLVPGQNDGENIVALAELATRLPRVDAIELLPCHSYGVHKYATLGRKSVDELPGPSAEALEGYRQILEARGLACTIGGQ